MKKISTIVLTAIVILLPMVAVAETSQEPLTVFDITHYEDWTYHRTGFSLDGQFIQQGKVNLFTTEGGEVVTLESPVLHCVDMDALQVWVDYRPHIPYTASKVMLQIDLLDAQANVVSTANLSVDNNLSMVELQTMLQVPESGDYTLLFSAPKADVDNCAAVRAVKVWAHTDASFLPGDINGDGMVDVGDINSIVNVVLGLESADAYAGRADVNGDGTLDVGDINSAINIVLGQ